MLFEQALDVEAQSFWTSLPGSPNGGPPCQHFSADTGAKKCNWNLNEFILQRCKLSNIFEALKLKFDTTYLNKQQLVTQ